MSNNNYSFSKTQKKNLKQLLDTLPRYELASGSEAFLLGYIAFESVSRMVWNYYRSVKTNKKINETHAPLPLPIIKSAFKAYNIKVSDVVLDTILNSEKRKGGRNRLEILEMDWFINGNVKIEKKCSTENTS